MMTNNYLPYVGGVPVSIQRLSEGLIDLGHQVAIFAPSYDGYQTMERPRENLTIYRYHSVSRGMASRYVSDGVVIGHGFDRRIQRWLLEFDADLLHVHHPFLIGSEALHLGHKYHIPVCLTYHTRFDQYLYYLKPLTFLGNHCRTPQGTGQNRAVKLLQEKTVPYYIRSFANRCDMVFAPTDSMVGYLRQCKIFRPIHTLPTGVSSGSFSPDRTHAQQIRTRYAEGRPHLLCTVSRLAEEKNLRFLLRGLAKLKEKIGDTFRCLVIGDGPQRKELESFARFCGIAQQVCFLGEIENHSIADYQAACDLFVFSSQTETQGIVLLEAMAVGNPVVAVDASGCRDVVKTGYNGILTKADEEDWAAAICTALQTPELRSNAFGTAAQYRTQLVAQKAAVLYKQMLETYHAERRA